uniref:4-methyl-5(B-hydroxyethyl)-thiazole monophosphate biosynthesis protein n=1 Tax=Phaseolus vulgaris TaxID=3885 RepID=V5N8C7_PHAVU|nr:4-methyl-5(b-hydroxyethyl)-thiazole monophosphate biosynthesis protein [Phaseolus vulgaris]
MALRHLRFFPHTLSLTLTSKPKLNNNNNNRFSFFTPSLSSTALMATSHKVLLPIANGSEPMEAVIIVDVLRRAGADVTVASDSANLSVLARHDVKILADASVSDVAGTSFDLVAIPGGIPGVENLRDCKVLEGLVKKHVEEGRLYAAVCAAPAVVLGPWGLLNGLKATGFPALMEKLASYAATTVESRVQVDGRAMTSRAPGTTMEFALALIEQFIGKEKADEVAGPLVMRSNHEDEHTFKELNQWNWTFDNPPQNLVPIANGSKEMETVIIIDMLRRAKANVVVASVEDKLEIVASRKVKLEADMLLDEAAKLSYDLIVLPGGLGGAQAFANSETLVNLLKKQRESNKYYGAICASPALVLEPHGLLKGKKAPAFPAMCNKLFDQSEVENRVVVDGNFITSRGPGTSLEFALAIVEKLFGRKLALELAKAVVFGRP